MPDPNKNNVPQPESKSESKTLYLTAARHHGKLFKVGRSQVSPLPPGHIFSEQQFRERYEPKQPEKPDPKNHPNQDAVRAYEAFNRQIGPNTGEYVNTLLDRLLALDHITEAPIGSKAAGWPLGPESQNTYDDADTVRQATAQTLAALKAMNDLRTEDQIQREARNEGNRIPPELAAVS